MIIDKSALVILIAWAIGIFVAIICDDQIKSLCKAGKRIIYKLGELINSWKTKINTILPQKLGSIKEKRKMRKKVLNLTLKKVGMETILTLKAAKEIEDFFKKAAKKSGVSDIIEVSKKWLDKNGKGLKFYVKNATLSNRVANYGPIMDNFGNGLMDGDGRINLALLRIEGISEEDGVSIKTDEHLTYQEVKEYNELLAEWTKSFYEENLRDQELVAEISFEV